MDRPDWIIAGVAASVIIFGLGFSLGLKTETTIRDADTCAALYGYKTKEYAVCGFEKKYVERK